MMNLSKELAKLDAAGLDPAVIQNHVEKKRQYQHGRSDDHHLALSIFSARQEAWKKEYQRRAAMEAYKAHQTANVGTQRRRIKPDNDDGINQTNRTQLPAWTHPGDNVDDLVAALESIPQPIQARLRDEKRRHPDRILAKGLRNKAVHAYWQAMMQTGYFSTGEEAQEIILQSIEAIKVKRSRK